MGVLGEVLIHVCFDEILSIKSTDIVDGRLSLGRLGSFEILGVRPVVVIDSDSLRLALCLLNCAIAVIFVVTPVGRFRWLCLGNRLRRNLLMH